MDQTRTFPWNYCQTKLMKPPFPVDAPDENISLKLLSNKTALLVALATGAGGSELVALSRTDHNLTFSRLPSGARHVSIRLVPKLMPKNARPGIIPKPLEFPGIAHLFSRDPDSLLCLVRTLGLYLVCSQELTNEDPQSKPFVHFTPKTQMFTTYFRRWVAETIRLTYQNSSESDLPTIMSHEVWAVTASVAYYRNTPLSELCGLISWKSANVYVHHYLPDMAVDTDLQELPVVAAGTTLLWQIVLCRLYAKAHHLLQ